MRYYQDEILYSAFEYTSILTILYVYNIQHRDV